LREKLFTKTQNIKQNNYSIGARQMRFVEKKKDKTKTDGGLPTWGCAISYYIYLGHSKYNSIFLFLPF